jgi:hypothetical protein
MHSPEPWHECCDDCSAIEDANDERIATVHCLDVEGDVDEALMKANKKRLVRCVNACRGLNPEVVPEMVAALDDLVDYAEGACDEGFGSATEQSDGMQAAIKKARELLARVRA